MLRLVVLFLCLFITPALAQEKIKIKPWAYWEQSNEQNAASLIHDEWDYFLRRVVTPHASGHHLVRYSDITDKDKTLLERYIKKLQTIQITDYSRDEQLAYWINLYNAGVVHLLLNHAEPIESIQDIDLSPDLFNDGPWEKKLFVIEDQDVSLSDIHHRILRPLWVDPLINYGLSCGAIGCPDLQYEAYTAKNVFFLLNRSASYFINHPRGAMIDQDGQLILSSFYDWYGDDFASSGQKPEQAVLNHLRQFADQPLQENLNTVKSVDDYQFNWAVNRWKQKND